MSEVLLTLHCAEADTESIIDALRSVTDAPLHIRAESVRGRDFGDADPAEQVTATLRRSAIECIEDEAQIAKLIAAVGGAKRRSAVRWHLTPVTARGRIT
jgi:hypothetical protein